MMVILPVSFISIVLDADGPTVMTEVLTLFKVTPVEVKVMLPPLVL